MGCVELLNSVCKRIKPKYHVFSHIHEGTLFQQSQRFLWGRGHVCIQRTQVAVHPPHLRQIWPHPEVPSLTQLAFSSSSAESIVPIISPGSSMSGLSTCPHEIGIPFYVLRLGNKEQLSITLSLLTRQNGRARGNAEAGHIFRVAQRFSVTTNIFGRQQSGGCGNSAQSTFDLFDRLRFKASYNRFGWKVENLTEYQKRVLVKFLTIQLMKKPLY